MRHSSVVHILSLEISVREMTPAAAFDPAQQYAVRETDDERASEISNEFYPEGRWTDDEHVDPQSRTDEQDEQSTQICQRARRVGYRDVQTRMLLGQWATNLAGLEQRLLNELELIGKVPTSSNEKVNNATEVARATQELLQWKDFRSDSELAAWLPRIPASDTGKGFLNYEQDNNFVASTTAFEIRQPANALGLLAAQEQSNTDCRCACSLAATWTEIKAKCAM